ncbi:hypothetical protein Tco_1374543 [Tanacetum coccineum]
MDAAADEKKIGKSSMDDEFKIRLVPAGYNCDLTWEQAREERREQSRLRILANKEFRGFYIDNNNVDSMIVLNRPRPRNKPSFTASRVPAKIVFSDSFPEGLPPPEPRILPPGFLSRAKVLNKDLGVSSEEKPKIYQSPVIKAFAKL